MWTVDVVPNVLATMFSQSTMDISGQYTQITICKPKKRKIISFFFGVGEYLEKTVPLFEIKFSQISFNVYDLEFNKEKLLDIEQDINQRLMCKLSTCSN